jgi:DeoR/GlpR family transcriptional regulator of sugar metabolism
MLNNIQGKMLEKMKGEKMKEKLILSSFEYRKNICKEEKLKIATFVVKLLSPGETIFLGAGTTVSYIGEEIAKLCAHYSLKIWTNNIGLINTWLEKYEKFFTFNFIGIVAGEFSSKNMSIINLSLPMSEIPKVIISSPAISSKGLSADNISTQHQVDSLIKRTHEIIIVADSSKIGKTETYITRSARMIKIDIKKKKKYLLITTKPSQQFHEIFENEISKLQQMGIETKIL